MEELREEWGIDLPRAHVVLAQLVSGRVVALTELITQSGLSRTSVERIVRCLGELVRHTPSGLVVGSEYRKGLGDYLADARRRTLTKHDRSEIVAKLRQILAARPLPNWRLDHVPATLDMIMRRTVYMHSSFSLEGANVLMFGDQDMTSIAFALISPSSQVFVVDVDERVLAFIESTREELGLRIRPAFADLRVGLPRSLLDSCQVVFTDPPYTEEGLALFLQRSVQSLSELGRTRILLAHGFGDRQLAAGYKAQAVIHRLRLVHHAMLPGFNKYEGAQAIGSSSDLHVLEPMPESVCRSAQGGRSDYQDLLQGERGASFG